MKDQVLKFLGDLPKSGSDQFNKALELLRKSKGHDAGKVRYYNNLGFSPERLDSLLYDLKKQYAVSDIEVAKASRSAKKVISLKKIEVNGPETVTASTNTEGKDAVDETVKSEPTDSKASEEKTEDPSSEEKKEVAAAETEEKIEDVKTLETASEEKIEADAVESIKETNPDHSSEFLKKLDGFDVEAHAYNSIKSFAAEVSKELELDPKDQKAVTLKAFIVDAKKKYFPA